MKILIPDPNSYISPRIKIDPWDSWSVDYTLALIIVPLLKQLKDTTHGAPNTDDSDVPEDLKSTSAPEKENEWDVDDNWFKRWDWIIDEMIWAFEAIIKDDYHYWNSKEYQDRIENGLRLFGKYYRGLWD